MEYTDRRLRAAAMIVGLLWIGLAPTAAMAEKPTKEKQLEAARVRVTNPYVETFGYLLGDRKTVVVPAISLDTGRDFEVTLTRHEGEDAPEDGSVRVRVVGDGTHRLYLIELEKGLPGTPLLRSETEIELGTRVWVLTGVPRMEDGPPERPPGLSAQVATTTVSSASKTRFSIAVDRQTLRRGAPVLDEAGALVGFVSGGTTVTRIEQVQLDKGHDRAMALLPLVGLRLGGEVGGPFGGAFLMDLEVGVSLWDRFSMLFRLGVSLAGDTTLRELPPLAEDSGPGVVEQMGASLRVGFETRYRQLLTGSSPLPIYIDLALGVQYGLVAWSPQGTALYGEAGCNPANEACKVRAAAGDVEDEARHTVGLSVGADLRIGTMSLGYRFLPKATGMNLENTHQILFGITAF